MEKAELLKSLASIERQLQDLDIAIAEIFRNERRQMLSEKLEGTKKLEKEMVKLEISFLLGRFKFDRRRKKHKDNRREMKLEWGY